MLDDNDFALALAVDTSVVVLEELSLHPQPEVREAVARNPNTPTEVLLKLGKEFPDAITANPIFNLLLLENPESHFVWLSLARSTTTSESAIARLSEIEDEEILCAVARNPKTPLHILEQLVENPPRFCDDENADESDFDKLFIAIAQNPNTSESLLLQLSGGSSNVQMAIAQNPKAPLSLLNKFADWRNFSMHKAIGRNPQAPSAILEKLAGENEKEIRDLVKNHPESLQYRTYALKT
jgi:Leucine rich repeat variant